MKPIEQLKRIIASKYEMEEETLSELESVQTTKTLIDDCTVNSKGMKAFILYFKNNTRPILNSQI